MIVNTQPKPHNTKKTFLDISLTSKISLPENKGTKTLFNAVTVTDNINVGIASPETMHLSHPPPLQH